MDVNCLLLWRRVIILVVTPISLLPLITLFDSKESKCSYVVILMAVYWLTEALPVGITSLLPIFLFPMFEIVSSGDIASMYVNDANMLFLGGLLMSAAIEYWQLHKRIALGVLRYVGAEPRWLLLGMMLITWFTSMWISNTATTAMMVPIVEAILNQFKASDIEHKLFNTSPDNMSGDVVMSAGDLTVSTSSSSQSTEATGKAEEGPLEKQKSSMHEADKQNQAETDKQQSGLLSDSHIHTDAEEDNDFTRFGKALSLSVCYSATCGGIACLTGTDPNLVLKSYTDALYSAHHLDNPVTFITWMAFGLPISVTVLLVCWAWLQVTYINSSASPGDFKRDEFYNTQMPLIKQILEDEYQKLGPLVRVTVFRSYRFGQVLMIILFVLLVLLWVTRDMGGLTGWGVFFDPPVKDGAPAIFMAVLLFCLPSTAPWLTSYNDPKHPEQWKRKKGHHKHKQAARVGSLVIRPLLTWNVAQQKVPWHIFLLLGGGYALSKGSEKSGLSTLIGNQLVILNGWNQWGILIVICYLTAATTEITSNITVATLLLPIMAQLALNTGVHPLYYMLPCTHACSFAFMLPVATPPNAIVFSYGRVQISDMVRTGLVLNVLSVPILIAITGTIGTALFDFDEMPIAFLNESLLRENIDTKNFA
ncbi:solute carrier family 13 member 2-like [Physella acuta]|uniref:solute carrier family 13 member 2-like n=1 Tax=Physella acuta TaxID=109671 RepID=UPI0027DB9E99|nr:solute carrier family 13 member 2-like [Physella acuta]